MEATMLDGTYGVPFVYMGELGAALVTIPKRIMYEYVCVFLRGKMWWGSLSNVAQDLADHPSIALFKTFGVFYRNNTIEWKGH